jgi:uncharacterized membrane protein
MIIGDVRKLPGPLSLLQSLITKELISGVVTSGPLMWLCCLLLLLVLIGVLLLVYTVTWYILSQLLMVYTVTSDVAT